MEVEVIQAGSEKEKESVKADAGYIGVSQAFMKLNKTILRDPNNSQRPIRIGKNTSGKYLKVEIQEFLKYPERYQIELRRAVKYMYGASSHFRRLIQYFVGLIDLNFDIVPYRMDITKVKPQKVASNYRKTANLIASMDLKSITPNILTVCLREDTYFGTIIASSDSITIRQLPSDYCMISQTEGNVPNVTFDFSFFDRFPDELDVYPQEFAQKYETIYKPNRRKNRWIALDCPNSFAVKCNSDNLYYSMPPFAGLLRELYDLEEYTTLKMLKTGLENYAMLVMQIPLNEDGEWGIDEKKAREFWSNLEAVMPEEVCTVLSPMEIHKISFEKTNTADVDTIAEAEDHLFTAAGVSSLLFNNAKASANALILSIKADKALTYGIVKNFAAAINRYLHEQSYGKMFNIQFLDVGWVNSKEYTDELIKLSAIGVPVKKQLGAMVNVDPTTIDASCYLENVILGLNDVFVPLMNATQMSSEDLAQDEGAPRKDAEDLSDSREENQESE